MNAKEGVVNDFINKAPPWSFVLYVVKTVEIDIDVMTSDDDD